jgi:hypothetical protein
MRLRRTEPPTRSAGLFDAQSPLIRDARYALVVQLIGLVVAVGSFLIDPVAGAIVVAAIILVAGAWGLYALRARETRAPWEILDLKQDWDLEDKDGREASCSKYQRVRFLQDEIFAVRDVIWGDTAGISNYSWTPGRVADLYRTGGKVTVLIALDAIRNRGDVAEFKARYTAMDAFTSNREWISFSTSHPTERLNVTVTFPKDRPPKTESITFTDDRDNYMDKDKYVKGSNTDDGRRHLEVTMFRPPIREEFTLHWEW